MKNFYILFIFLACFVLQFASTPAKAQFTHPIEDNVFGRAFNQTGTFCGYWDDSEDSGDGVYGISILRYDNMFKYTIYLLDNPRVNERKIIALPVGTPINFDFDIRQKFYGGELIGPTPTLTRVQVTGSPDEYVCPQPKADDFEM